MRLTLAELCGGAGGAALGIERAGFEHVLICEIDADACNTLRHNRPSWKVAEDDIRNVDGRQSRGLDLLSGGMPCQPFSIGDQRFGAGDERDLPSGHVGAGPGHARRASQSRDHERTRVLSFRCEQR
jgi:DNA (cytosine-5)-methyltransferase 1